MQKYKWWLVAIIIGAVLAFCVNESRSAINVTPLSTLQQKVRAHLATDADSYHPNDTLTLFINTACREIASYGVIQRLDTVAVSSGTIKVALNDDCLDVFCALPCTASNEAKYAGIAPLGRIDFKDWSRVGATTQETHSKFYAVQPAQINPQGAAVAGVTAPNLWLCPQWGLGSDSIWVFYYAQATELSATTDTCTIPYSYIPLVEYYATALAYARVHNFNEAAWWFALYDRTRQEKGLLKQLDYVIKLKVIE